VRSADSVAANLSEGFGRFHYKENTHFNYFSRGSLSETKTWISKAHKRNLISDVDYDQLINQIEDLGVRLNNYINSIGKRR
jgi:four helix bundle protein